MWGGFSGSDWMLTSTIGMRSRDDGYDAAGIAAVDPSSAPVENNFAYSSWQHHVPCFDDIPIPGSLREKRWVDDTRWNYYGRSVGGNCYLFQHSNHGYWTAAPAGIGLDDTPATDRHTALPFSHHSLFDQSINHAQMKLFWVMVQTVTIIASETSDTPREN